MDSCSRPPCLRALLRLKSLAALKPAALRALRRLRPCFGHCPLRTIL